MARPTTKPEITDKTYTDAKADQLAQATGDELKEQPKVRVRLPLDKAKREELEAQIAAGRNVPWPAESVWVNGYQYVIKLGETVEVPQTVAEILEQAGKI